MENELLVFSDPTTLSMAAAELVLGLANEAIQRDGRFTIVLSGGHTPERLYAQLAQPPFRDEMPWDKIFFFWGDERCVPINDPQNNANQAISFLLNHVPVPTKNIFRINTHESPELAAMAYERTIVDFFKGGEPRFDLVLLGLGENGHTASLFPGTTAVDEQIKLVTEVFVPELNMFRITMTSRLINGSANILFLVTGKGKAAILKIVFSQSNEKEKIPALLIHPVDGNLLWMADSAAAAEIV